MNTLIYDTFNDALNTNITTRASEIGGTPFKNAAFNAGIPLAVSGQIYPTVDTTVICWPTIYYDVDVTCKVDTKSTIPLNNYLAIAPRMASGSASWHVFGVNPNFGGTTYNNFAYDTGSGNYPLPANGSVLSTGEHTVKYCVKGTLYRGFIDGREIFRSRSDSIPSGHIGVLWGGASTTTNGTHLKEITATSGSVTNQIQFIGDSMFRGDTSNSATPGDVVNVGIQYQVPYVAMQVLNSGTYNFDWSNLGVSGRQISVMETASATTYGANAFPSTTSHNTSVYGHGADLCRRTEAEHDIVVILGGINDLASTGGNVSASTCINRLQSLISGRKALGFTVIVCTIPYCDESKSYAGSGFNAKVDTVNAWIRANTAGADLVIDLHNEPTVGGNETNSTYRNIYDGVHWTTLSMTTAGYYIGNQINNYLLSNNQVYSLINSNRITRNGSVSIGYAGIKKQSKDRTINTQINISVLNDVLGGRLDDNSFYWNGT